MAPTTLRALVRRGRSRTYRARAREGRGSKRLPGRSATGAPGASRRAMVRQRAQLRAWPRGASTPRAPGCGAAGVGAWVDAEALTSRGRVARPSVRVSPPSTYQEPLIGAPPTDPDTRSDGRPGRSPGAPRAPRRPHPGAAARPQRTPRGAPLAALHTADAGGRVATHARATPRGAVACLPGARGEGYNARRVAPPRPP